MQRKLPVQRANLHVPPLQDIAKVLQDGLSKNFADVDVKIVDCPDLTQEPFMLADKGLSGSPRLADIGGVPYLVPLAQTDKVYNFDDIARLTEVPDGFIIGAGAGPVHIVGVNSELIPNIKVGEGGKINTHCCHLDIEQDKCYILKKIGNKEFCILMNVFISEGKPGKVLEVKAKRRTGPENYVSCIRKTLTAHYGNKPVGLGGAFLLKDGKAKIHVMPNFSKTPLLDDEAVNSWLHYFEMQSPLVCLGQLTSHDPGLDLRMEHFHCFSSHGDGGHYHFDTTPDFAEYIGYFNVGEYMYRIDRPTDTHQFGRD